MQEKKKITELNALLLDCPSLGWINCDRFYEYKNKKIEVVVKSEGNFIPNVVLVFKDINSVMAFSYRVDNEIIFSNIPENEPFEIIGLYKDDTVSLLAQKAAVATPGNTESILFKKMSAEEISTTLKNLN